VKKITYKNEKLLEWLDKTSNQAISSMQGYCLNKAIQTEKAHRLAGTLTNTVNRKYYYFLNSLNEFLREVESIDDTKIRGRASIENDEYFCESKSYSEGLERIKHPEQFYKSEVQDMIKDQDKINAQGNTNAIESSIDYAQEGDFIDVSRFIEGLPDSFVKSQDMDSKRPFVKLIVGHNNCSCAIESKSILEYAKHILRIVTLLMANNISVSLEYVKIGDTIAITFPIKDYNEGLNVYKIYSILHTSFFRRIVFRAIENSSQFKAGYGAGNCYLDLKEYNKTQDQQAIQLIRGETFENMLDKVCNSLGIKL
jgi:hypothetical protein